jgi:hypothetical protein
MAEDNSDGGGPQAHELSTNAERDVLEMVCGEELPAQWKKYPVKTQLEMKAGRNSLGEDVVAAKCRQWADEGEKWLYSAFGSEKLVFHTAWDCSKRTITLSVCTAETAGPDEPIRKQKLLFEVTEPAVHFVSQLTAVKIALVS